MDRIRRTLQKSHKKAPSPISDRALSILKKRIRSFDQDYRTHLYNILPFPAIHPEQGYLTKSVSQSTSPRLAIRCPFRVLSLDPRLHPDNSLSWPGQLSAAKGCIGLPYFVRNRSTRKSNLSPSLCIILDREIPQRIGARR